jgi:hypothetical protein
MYTIDFEGEEMVIRFTGDPEEKKKFFLLSEGGKKGVAERAVAVWPWLLTTLVLLISVTC